MHSDRACISLDPPVVSHREAAGCFEGPALLGVSAALLRVCSWLLPVVIAYTASASLQLAPTQGNPAVLESRNIAGNQGARYRLPGGIRVSLSPDAQASIAAQPQMLALASGKRTPTYSVFLKSGKVDVDLPENNTGAVAVAGPADVRVIARRGQFSSLVTGHAVYAFSPKYPLLVSQKERLSTLPPGVVRRFSRAEPPVDRPALSAPKWLAGQKIWLAFSGHF